MLLLISLCLQSHRICSKVLTNISEDLFVESRLFCCCSKKRNGLTLEPVIEPDTAFTVGCLIFNFDKASNLVQLRKLEYLLNKLILELLDCDAGNMRFEHCLCAIESVKGLVNESSDCFSLGFFGIRLLNYLLYTIKKKTRTQSFFLRGFLMLELKNHRIEPRINLFSEPVLIFFLLIVRFRLKVPEWLIFIVESLLDWINNATSVTR